MSVYYTTAEVAKLLKVNITKVGKWIDSGELTAINVGNGRIKPRYRISEESI